MIIIYKNMDLLILKPYINKKETPNQLSNLYHLIKYFLINVGDCDDDGVHVRDHHSNHL